MAAVTVVPVYSCLAMDGLPSPQPTAPTDHDYEFFLLDAATETGALEYLDGAPTGCGEPGRDPPTVQIPREQVSVPWTLGARAPDGYSATITAQVLPCDAVAPIQTMQEGDDTVQVIADRAVGASCGSPGPVSLTLHAATRHSTLPATIGHAPVGLFLGPYS